MRRGTRRRHDNVMIHFADIRIGYPLLLPHAFPRAWVTHAAGGLRDAHHNNQHASSHMHALRSRPDYEPYLRFREAFNVR